MIDDQFDPPKEDALTKAAMLGVDVQHFLTQEKVGMYLLERAEAEKREAFEAFADIDPTDVKAIRELQFKYRIPDMFEKWVADAVYNGLAAEQNIKIEEQGGR